MKYIFISLFLSGCFIPYVPDDYNTRCGPPLQRTPTIINLNSLPKHQEQHTVEDDEVPYPDARFPENPGAVASSPDSNCFGLIEIFGPEPVRVGTWAIVVYVDETYSQFLYFNTEQDAWDCAGSEPANLVKMTKSGWMEVERE